MTDILSYLRLDPRFLRSRELTRNSNRLRMKSESAG